MKGIFLQYTNNSVTKKNITLAKAHICNTQW